MRKKYYRFFGGFMTWQEKWLNKMAASGHRLTRTTKAMYEFEQCPPGQVQYRVEFVGHDPREAADDYARFLEDCGYRVFFKNINLNCSIGKVRVRPWADRGGRLATTATTYGRELLIVEKEADGRPFELHTTYEDKQAYYRHVKRPWLFLFLASAVLGVVTRQILWGAFAALSLAALVGIQIESAKLKKRADTEEW